MPLSHLTLTVSHLPTSTSFFLSCLQPLGYQFIGRHDDYIGFGQNPNEPADFWITEQKPGSPAGAAHVAFPAPSKAAVNSFFICALKAGGKIHGEPKMRDSQSGYFSAAIMDADGNSIEAVYRPSSSSSGSVANSVARSELTKPALALLESGSVVSRTSSKVSSIKTESIAPPRSDMRSYTSKAMPAVERAVPSERSMLVQNREIQQAPSQTYIVHTHTTQKSDDGKTAKTIVGTLIGAAAGAALAYALSKGDSETTETKSSPQFSVPQYSADDFRQLLSGPQAPPEAQDYERYAAIEAPPARSTYSHNESHPPLTRSVTSKNPRASTIYEATEFAPRGASIYLDDGARRASEGTIYSPSEIPLRAIEYPPELDADPYPGDMSTLISSFREKSRISDKGSVYSQASTIKAPRAPYYDDQQSSHHGGSRRSSASNHSSAYRPQAPGSTASSNRTARQVPLPEDSIASFSSYRSGAKSGVSSASRRDAAPIHADSYDDFDIDMRVTPADSISQVGDSRRSSHSHRSHSSKQSRASKHSSSKFDDPVKPSDSVSQVSSHASRASQRTVKAGGSIADGASKAGSRMSSRRGSQVV